MAAGRRLRLMPHAEATLLMCGAQVPTRPSLSTKNDYSRRADLLIIEAQSVSAPFPYALRMQFRNPALSCRHGRTGEALYAIRTEENTLGQYSCRRDGAAIPERTGPERQRELVGIGVAGMALPFLSAPVQSASGSSSGSQLTPQQRAMGRFLANWADFSAYRAVERRCRLLSETHRREIEWHYTQAFAALGPVFGNDFIAGMTKVAAKTFAQEPCDGEQAKTYSGYARDLGRRLIYDLGARPYSAEVRAEFDGVNVTRVLAGQLFDDQCRIMNKDERAEFDRNVQQITDRYIQSQGAAAFEEKRTRAMAIAEKTACDERVKSELARHAAMARRLTARSPSP